MLSLMNTTDGRSGMISIDEATVETTNTSISVIVFNKGWHLFASPVELIQS